MPSPPPGFLSRLILVALTEAIAQPTTEAARRLRAEARSLPQAQEPERVRASLERLLTRQGDFAWATFVYRELLRRDSEDAEARYNLGRALKQKDTAGAIERFREAVRLAPKYPEAHYQLALALAAAGAREEARAQFEEAHRLAPHLKPPEAPQ